MSIRKRLASFIFLMTGLLIVMGIALMSGGPVIVGAFRQSLDSMNALDGIRELRANVMRQRNSLNRYLLVDDEQELLSFEDASRQAQSSLDAIGTRLNNNRKPAWYSELEELFNTTRTMAKDVADQYKAGHKARAYDEVSSTLLPQFQRLVSQVDALEREKAAEAQSMFEKIRVLCGSFQMVVIVMLGAVLLLGLVLFRSLYKAVMKPLQILRSGADEFGKGHWNYRIEWTDKNEFGALAQSFNAMAENVKQLQMQAVHMDRMSAVGQLAGGVAHEINNPLTAVLGQAQLLMAKLPEMDPAHAQIKKIEQAALRCKKIVRGLLDFSRPSQSTFEEIDLNSIVLATLDLCEADLKRARVNLEKKLGRTLPKIGGNSSELQQVILNLINNAIQAMPRGGTLTLETSSPTQKILSLDRSSTSIGKVQGPFIEVVVKDSGVGIPAENLDRVFEPFFTTKEIGKGTGLGLAVSTGIVEKHGGTLRVESAGLNRGSSFFLMLPLSKPATVFSLPDDSSLAA